MPILAEEFKLRIEALETGNKNLLATTQENRNRHTNSDSSMGAICAFLDRFYHDQDPPRDCCFESHTDEQTGNFITCLSRVQAGWFFGNAGNGVCAKTCSGLSPIK